MFDSAKIDASLVRTLSGLALWDTPRKQIVNKIFEAIPVNLIYRAGGEMAQRESSFRGYLEHCMEFARACHLDQRIVVQLALQKVLQLAAERDPLYEGSPDPYCKPLSVENWWGKVVICLCLAFKVELPRSVSVPKHRPIEV